MLGVDDEVVVGLAFLERSGFQGRDFQGRVGRVSKVCWSGEIPKFTLYQVDFRSPTNEFISTTIWGNELDKVG